MRFFKFDAPYKVTNSILKREYLNNPQECYYERSSAVITKHGIVIVDEMKWQHNSGWTNFSIFTTVIDGIRYTATLKEGKTTERQIKWRATNFIKTVIKRIKDDKG